MSSFASSHIAAIILKDSRPIDQFTYGHLTDGGTYILSEITASGGPGADLVAVTPSPVGGSRVFPLSSRVRESFLSELREVLDSGDVAAESFLDSYLA